MDVAIRKILAFANLILFSMVIVLTPFPNIINTLSYELVNYMWEGMGLGNLSQNMILLIGIFGEMIAATILIATPFSLLGGFWMGRLSYVLLISDLEDLYFFNMPVSVNIILGLLCFIIFAYSFVEQNKWLEKFFNKRAGTYSDKNLSKLI